MITLNMIEVKISSRNYLTPRPLLVVEVNFIEANLEV